MKNWFAWSRLALVALVAAAVASAASPSASAQELRLTGDFTQGGLITGQAPAGSRVWFEGSELRVGADGFFVFGLARDAASAAGVVVERADGSRIERRIEVAARAYDIERIDGLPPKMVTPDPATEARIAREGQWIGDARARSTDVRLFTQGFIRPAKGRISGVYGSQRILNGKPRHPHLGLDIAGPKGSPVIAAADGEVSLAERDLYYTGGTVVLDHGNGISTIYSHMSKVSVALGQMVRQGAAIGAIGATGRVTGPHLDFRVNWFQIRLDPALLLPKE